MLYEIEKGLDWKQAAPILRRLPRSMIMPVYFVEQLDHDRAEAGESRSGDILRVGGSDLHFDRSRSEGAFGGPGKLARFVMTPAGEPPRAGEGVEFNLEAAGLDAMIDFLIDVRKGIVAPGSHEDMSRAITGSLEGVEDLHERHRVLVETAGFADSLLNEMISVGLSREDRLELLAAVLTIMSNGDRISDIGVARDDGTPAVFNVHAEEDTNLAMTSSERMESTLH